MDNCFNCLNKEDCSPKKTGSTNLPTYGKCGDSNSLPEITSVFLVLTQACNLKCKYCFVVQKPREMTYQIAKDAADYVARNAKLRGEVPCINFFGGEPLLKWKEIIVPLTDYIRETYGNAFELSMTTNGVLLDEPKLIYMRKNKIGFMVSIDGAQATQDKNRPCSGGGSSFEIIEPRIPMYLLYNPNMTFRATVDHDNAGDYLENHIFAYEKGYTNMFSIVNVFSQWSEDEKATLSKQIRLVADFYLEKLKSGKPFGIQPFEGMFRKIDLAEDAKRMETFRTAGEGLLAYGRCGLGASRFASVGTDGRLYSCQEMCDNDDQGLPFVIGDIYTGTDPKKRMDIINKFDTKKVKSTEDMDCGTCPFYLICDGACAINNYFSSGDLNIMPSILCFYYQCLYREAQRIRYEINKYQQLIENSRKRGIIK